MGTHMNAISQQSIHFANTQSTNSLIITADRDDYATLVEIIRQIDIPRSMVYIEALIMEVDVTDGLHSDWIRAVARIADADTRIVSMTITEGGYPVDDQSGAYVAGSAAAGPRRHTWHSSSGSRGGNPGSS